MLEGDLSGEPEPQPESRRTSCYYCAQLSQEKAFLAGVSDQNKVENNKTSSRRVGEWLWTTEEIMFLDR